MSQPTIGFAGLGAMGSGMAWNLQKFLSTESRSLLVFNRTESKCEEVVSAGATLCKSFDEIVTKSDILFGMTFDDANLMEAAEAIAANMDRKSGLIYISCATVDPETTQKTDELLKSAGVTLVACPVFGRPDAARNKMLVAVVGGSESAKQTIKPYVDAVSRATWDQGTEPHLANVMKLCGNFVLASTLEVLSESMALADSYNLPRARILDFVDLFMPSMALKNYAANIANNNFEITPTKLGFPVRGGIKDVGLAMKAAERMGQRLRVAEVVKAHLQERIDKGGAELDWASVVFAVKEDRL